MLADFPHGDFHVLSEKNFFIRITDLLQPGLQQGCLAAGLMPVASTNTLDGLRIACHSVVVTSHVAGREERKPGNGQTGDGRIQEITDADQATGGSVASQLRAKIFVGLGLNQVN